MMEWSGAICRAGLAIVLAASAISCKKTDVSSISGTLRVSREGRVDLETNQEGFSYGITGVNQIRFDAGYLAAFERSRGDKDLEWTPATMDKGAFVFAASAKRGRWRVQSGNHQVTLENGHSYLMKIHDGGIDLLKSDSKCHSAPSG